jgi:hypothetical protein
LRPTFAASEAERRRGKHGVLGYDLGADTTDFRFTALQITLLIKMR